MIASLLWRRVDHVLRLLLKFQNRIKLPYSLFLRVTSMLTTASAVVPLGLLQLRPLQVWMNGLQLDPRRHKHRRVRVSRQYLQVPPCRAHLTTGVPLGLIPSRQEVVVADAYASGWRVVWRHRKVRGLWSAQQRQEHINGIELCTIFLAQAFFGHPEGPACPRPIRQHLGCLPCKPPWGYRSRPVSAGGTSAPLMDLSSPGKLQGNLPRGGPSLPPGHPKFVGTIWHRNGRAEVDLYASEASTQCPL